MTDILGRLLDDGQPGSAPENAGVGRAVPNMGFMTSYW
jgi:hypothetical protein